MSPAMLPLATSFGATETHDLSPDAPELADQSFDVVVDTTGNPDGLTNAIRLARREVHLKSTHGQPACGLAHLTELVVDELSIEPFPADQPPAHDAFWRHIATDSRARVAWLAAQSDDLRAHAHTLIDESLEQLEGEHRSQLEPLVLGQGHRAPHLGPGPTPGRRAARGGGYGPTTRRTTAATRSSNPRARCAPPSLTRTSYRSATRGPTATAKPHGPPPREEHDKDDWHIDAQSFSSSIFVC